MTGSNYKIRWDSINAGGGEDLSGASYNMYSTTAEVGPGRSTGSTYVLNAGYQQAWAGRVFTMRVEAQQDSSQTAYSAFSNANKTVTVSSLGGITVADYIAVVENEGPNQMVAIGVVDSIASNTITVDKWSGDHAAMSSSPVGGNDYVYELNGHAINLDQITTSNVNTGVATVDVTASPSNGYTCTIREDGDFSNGIDEIDDVADTAVTAGSEEYGIEKTGDDVSGGGDDDPITGTNTTIMTTASSATDRRLGVIYKASVASDTSGGHYEHTTIYECTVNY